MGKSTSVPEFAGKIQQAGTNLKRSQKSAIEKDALAAKQFMTVAARQAAGGDMALSGMKNRKLTIGYKTVGTGALVFARGPWGLTEFGASPHIISSRRGGGSRRSRSSRLSAYGPAIGRGRIRGAINIPGYGWKAYARHPGTTGKHTWERRFRALRHVAFRNTKKTSVAAVERAF